jgi:hypothetical protein
MRMATSTIIRSVTEALVEILRGDLAGLLDSANIKAAPPETVGDARAQMLILYLYQVLESPFLKNTGSQAVVQDRSTPPQTVKVKRDPLALDLHYLLIPTSPEDRFLDTYDILGAAMKAFHDHGTFSPGAFGVEDLAEEEKKLEFRLTLNPLSTSDLIRLWEAVHRPYRLSVAYVVRTVLIDSALETDERLVTERRLTAVRR